MLLRVAVIASACVVGAASAMTEELGPEQARAFVVGKLFSYTCFDGTVGMGRIFADGSVIGTIRPGGRGEVRFASLPAGTLRIEGSAMCAHLSGLPMQPCFRVEKIDYRSFRGSIAGLGFAYCDFSQHNARAQIISRGPEPRARVTSRMLARAQAAPAPSVPVQIVPIVPVQAAPAAPLQPAPAPIAPVQVTPSVPADTTPTATLRPAIAD